MGQRAIGIDKEDIKSVHAPRDSTWGFLDEFHLQIKAFPARPMTAIPVLMCKGLVGVDSKDLEGSQGPTSGSMMI